MAKDVEDHLRCATVGHPVFRVHQQRVAAPTEDFLHGFDQLDAEHRRRRHDDGARVVEQFLLQLAEGFPVQQARGLLEVELAAPAPGAGVEHHQCRGGWQHVVPLLEFQQVADQFILGAVVQVAALGVEVAGFLQQRAEGIRVVAPALAQHVGEQGVADDALGERMAVGGFFPLGAEVPVVGDVVVVEDHQAGQVGERPGYVAQALLEAVDPGLFQGVALTALGCQHRWLRVDQGPGGRGPYQQVHGHDFGEGHQVIVGAAAGEDRLARTSKKPLAQAVVTFQRRQQVGAMVVAGRVLVERGAVLHHCAVQVLAVQPQAFDQCMDGPQHRPGHIVGVDLVAAHHQQCRALARFMGRRQQLVDAEQAIIGWVMGLAARAVQQLIDAAAQDEVRALGLVVEQMRGPLGNAEQAGVVLADQQVVVDADVLGQGAVQLDVDQVDKGMGADRDDPALRRIEHQVAHRRQAQGQRQLPRPHQPQHQARRFQAPQQRADQDGGQRCASVGVWGWRGHPGRSSRAK